MNRIVLSATLLLCVEAIAGAQLTVRPAHLPSASADVAARLAALDPSGRLRATAVAADGSVRRLSGPLALQGATPAERAADFLARFAPLFGADDTVAFGAPRAILPRADGTPRALRLPQTVHGFEATDAGLTLSFDELGRATGAHGFVSAEAARLPAPTLPAAQAIAAALAAVGVDAARLTGAPSATGIVLAGSQPALAWRVRFTDRAGLQPWRVDVDAHGGGVLAARLDRYTATGNIVLVDVPHVFATGNGSGSLYASAAKALVESASIGSLPSLTLDDIDQGLALIAGTLTGRYTTVSDFQAVLFSPALFFPFSDTSPVLLDGVIQEYEAFDHVNTYAWISRTAKYYGKITGALSSDTCVPAIVNFDENEAQEHVGYPNAFFTPNALPGGVFAPGYFVFGDLDVITDDPMDDFGRDPTIVSHEYFHCMADFAGLLFGNDEIDTPPRAVNEAIADYGSATFHDTPLIGKALVFHAGADMEKFYGFDVPDGELRDLSEEITLQDNLNDAFGETGLPEEHEAGKIFGCALWRLRTLAKTKKANDLIVNHLADWPQSTLASFPDPVTPGNAAAAYEAYDLDCFLAIINAGLAPGGSKGWKAASSVLGAFLAHGITGATPTNIVVLPTDTGKATLSFKSAFLGTQTDHVFQLALAEGQQLSIKLTGDKDDATQIGFEFIDGPGPLNFTLPPVENPEGTKLSQKGILVAETGVYTLDLSTASGPGAYKLVLKIK